MWSQDNEWQRAGGVGSGCSMLKCIVIPDLQMVLCASVFIRVGMLFSRCSGAATHCNTLQHTATYCITLRKVAAHCSTKHCNTLQRTATHCNALQHTATHCITLQHTATHCNTLQHTAAQSNTLHHTASRVFFLRIFFTSVYKLSEEKNP